jgi:aminopeptidase N
MLTMARLDPHSYTDSEQPQTDSLDWRARIDFDRRVVEAEATLTLRTPADGLLDLDTRELQIEEVTGLDGRAFPFAVSEPEKIVGARLRIELPVHTSAVRIRYRTASSASALQWLEPAQTFGKSQPFLFSQCQAIHARSIVPIQDTPRIRIRYRAELTIPKPLRGLMAARFIDRQEIGATAVERYQTAESIPPYLLALAVGELAFRDLSNRSRVWAEPSIVDRAAWEFAGVDSTLGAAEALFGPYLWERFDILTMPLSFPYGGMENPRLTFLTPTVLAGDRSLVNVVAHELAHSWTGNLVTNASAEHFWLNEGFTVFAERRILEALEGAEVGALHAALGRRALDEAIERFKDRPELTRLRTQLAGIDPDEAFSTVPYEKGYLFLRTIEEAVGRTAFDSFLRKYLERFVFHSITTEEFIAMLDEVLPQARKLVDVDAWIFGVGVPPGAPAPHSSRLEAIAGLGANLPLEALANTWTPAEWQLYLESVPKPAPLQLCDALDARFRLSQSRNYEILVAWLVLALWSGYSPALPAVERVLGQVGRMKYLRPIYTALTKNPETRQLALQYFERFGSIYHPIARHVVESVLQSGSTACAQ